MLEIGFGSDQTFDHVVIREDLTGGQTISTYVVEVFRSGRWEGLCSGLTVGPQRIHRVEPVTTSKLRVRVLSSLTGQPKLRSFKAYLAR